MDVLVAVDRRVHERVVHEVHALLRLPVPAPRVVLVRRVVVGVWAGTRPALSHGLAETVREFYALLPDSERERFRHAVIDLMESSPPYRIFDEWPARCRPCGIGGCMFGRVDREISFFARWGPPTGEYSEYGFPIRAIGRPTTTASP